MQQIESNKVEFILAMEGQLDSRKLNQFKMPHQQKTVEIFTMISNDTGEAFAKIINQFLLQTLRALGKMETVYDEELQIFTNDREKYLPQNIALQSNLLHTHSKTKEN